MPRGDKPGDTGKQKRKGAGKGPKALAVSHARRAAPARKTARPQKHGGTAQH